jgi:hypothetical protein
MHSPDLMKSMKVQSGSATHSLKHSPPFASVASGVPRDMLRMIHPAGKHIGRVGLPVLWDAKVLGWGQHLLLIESAHTCIMLLPCAVQIQSMHFHRN